MKVAVLFGLLLASVGVANYTNAGDNRVSLENQASSGTMASGRHYVTADGCPGLKLASAPILLTSVEPVSPPAKPQSAWVSLRLALASQMWGLAATILGLADGTF